MTNPTTAGMGLFGPLLKSAFNGRLNIYPQFSVTIVPRVEIYILTPTEERPIKFKKAWL